MRKINLPWTTVITQATTPGDFHPATPWLPVDPGITAVGAWLEARAIQGTGMSVQLAVQVTNDVLTPGTGTGLGAARTTNGVGTPASSSPTVNTSKFMRFGYLALVTSGAGNVRVMGEIELTS